MSKRRKRSFLAWGSAGRWLAILVGVAVVGGGLAAVIQGSGSRSVVPRKPVAVHIPLPPVPAPTPAATPRPAIAELPPPPAPTIQPPPPAVRSPELPAWRRFAIPSAAADGRPLIAVVIDDLGIDHKRSARAVALPAPLTLSWLPYANDVRAQAAAGRAAGHETMVHVPMQPEGRENPGPNALTVDLPPDEIRRRLTAALSLFPEAVGVNNHMGSRFTRDARALAPVIDELKMRGLLLLDSRTSGGSVAADLAREAGVPAVARDVFLDNQTTPDYVRARLAEVEAVARRHGAAVAIGHPHDATLEVLEAWLRTAQARGFALVPLSAIVKRAIDRPAIAARG